MTSSVFGTDAAREWIVLLEALEQPHRTRRVRRLAVSPFVGWDAAILEARGSDDLGLRLRSWVQLLEERGIAALFQAVSGSELLAARLLGQTDGERQLTDLRHVGEALHDAAMQGQLGLTAILKWLRRRVDESGKDESKERSRRLDTDAAAVQVATIHASKGLEFPVVYVPFAWNRFVFDVDVPLFHDDDGRRVRDVTGEPVGDFEDNVDRHKAEDFGEDLRLLYVALTRAQAQVTAWWAPNNVNTPYSPLHRLLFTEDPTGPIPMRVVIPSDEAVLARIRGLAVDGALSVTEVTARPPSVWTPARQPTPSLAAAVFSRTVDTSWRRTSYSSLTAPAYDAGPRVGSEPEIEQKDDEPETPPEVIAAATDDELRAVLSPMGDFVGSAAFGTLVHSVFEEIDPTAADLFAEVRAHAATQLAWQGGGVDADVLAAGLLQSLRTPLGPIADGLALCDISPADRLAELDFELPLCGGDEPSGQAHLRDLAPLLRDHLPAGDPLAAYADLLLDPLLGDTPLRGYLGGSIDAVLRVGGRYLVVDYKTNRLVPRDETLTAWHYRMPAMADAMLHAQYPLQALLYDVALHRYLRWRLADYDPEEHLGGVLYLFLRGMCGPGVVAADGSVPGVFAWQPPAALVVELSSVLAKGAR